MRTIWKYELGVVDEQWVEMPEDAKILCVQIQQRVPCLWAMVDSEAPKKKRCILTLGTGNPIMKGTGQLDYIGTYQMSDGRLVFHVFEAR